MQIALGPTAVFHNHNFMTFDRSAGRRRDFYTRKKKINYNATVLTCCGMLNVIKRDVAER